MTRISVLLPTCEPEALFTYFIPSVHRIQKLNSLLEFNICFQPPYTEAQINEALTALNNLGFKVNYDVKDYKPVKPYIPLLKMRNDCSLMTPEADFYCLMDDEFSFESEEACNYFIKALNLFDEDANLGVISFFNQPVQNWRENFYSTNSGLIYRGGKYYGFKGLVPQSLNDFNVKVNTLVPYQNENLINLFGGFQDKFCAMIRLATGAKGLSINNVPINHTENRKEKGSVSHGWDAAKFESGSIAQFIEKYFNPIFLQTHSLTLFDKTLDRQIYPNNYINGQLKPELDIYCPNGIKKVFYEEYTTTYAKYHLPVLTSNNGQWHK